MANTKISQLPLYSGTAADLRWFVMNNSGETETFKFSGYTSPYKSNTSTNNSNNIYDTTDVSGFFSSIIGGTGNTITTTGVANNIIGGFSNDILTDYYETSYASIIGGQNNTISKLMNGSGVIVGGSSNTINAKGESVILGGFGNTMGSYQCIIGGYQCSMPEGSNQSILYGNQSTMYDCNFSILVGQNSTSNNSNHSTNLGGLQNSITNASKSAIIGGNNNTITGGTNVIMLGTSGRTADATYTTYVENLRVFRQAQYGNYNNGSTATNYTIDWNNGNIQKVVLTGSCVFSATNITDGTTYIFKVEQDNSGNRAATWSSGIFKFANGTPPTLSTGANDVDIFTFVAMDGLLYGVAQLNFG
jgi:hypothetical protein